MAMIPSALLAVMLATLSVQEMRDVHGLTKLEFPWVAVELVIHAMIVRRLMQFDVPQDIHCLEFFAGSHLSSQVAKAFGELGLPALAFDILRGLSLIGQAERTPKGPHYVDPFVSSQPVLPWYIVSKRLG